MKSFLVELICTIYFPDKRENVSSYQAGNISHGEGIFIPRLLRQWLLCWRRKSIPAIRGNYCSSIMVPLKKITALPVFFNICDPPSPKCRIEVLTKKVPYPVFVNL